MNNIHIYQFRHLFADDDHIGKYTIDSREVRLFKDHAHQADRVKSFFAMRHGIIVARVLIGDEKAPETRPLMEFPAEIRALMTPHQGHRTPAAMHWAAMNFPPDEYERRYGCPPPAVPDPVPTAIEIEVDTDATPSDTDDTDPMPDHDDTPAVPDPVPAAKKRGRPAKQKD